METKSYVIDEVSGMKPKRDKNTQIKRHNFVTRTRNRGSDNFTLRGIPKCDAYSVFRHVVVSRMSPYRQWMNINYEIRRYLNQSKKINRELCNGIFSQLDTI